jgi:hypothetical protein
MPRDPRATLHAGRRRTVEQARQALAMCLAAEADTLDRIAALDASASRDRDAATVMADDPRFLDMFAVRRETTRTDRRIAVTGLMALEDSTAAARANVVAARTATERVEQFMAERAEAERAGAASRTQHALDDIARFRQSGQRSGPRDV